MLGVARKRLVAPRERSDFEFLAAKPFWPGRRLEIVLEHVVRAEFWTGGAWQAAPRPRVEGWK